ncbi:MAG: hypothetical protein ACO1Q7_08990 [Gemmatimonas sp.]
MKKAVEEMKSLVAQQAKKSGASFAAIGVANDWDLRIASEFIARNGAWDQLVLGGNWTNIGIDQFMWKDAKALPALPQIVVIERTVKLGAGVMISEPKFLRRIIGGDSIPAWVREGAPVALAKP